jgi:hypothetical protein
MPRVGHDALGTRIRPGLAADQSPGLRARQQWVDWYAQVHGNSGVAMVLEHDLTDQGRDIGVAGSTVAQSYERVAESSARAGRGLHWVDVWPGVEQ